MDIDRRAALGGGIAGIASLSAAAFAPAMAQATPATTPGFRPLRVKGLVIGEGRPKLIVSITETTPEAALLRSRELAAMPEIDMLEYRLDHLADWSDAERVAASVTAIGAACGPKPLLLTFRTRAEGGEAAIAPAAYARLYAAALRHGGADLIDLQHALCAEAPVAAVLRQARVGGCPVVMSYHNFQSTPPVAVMVAKLRAMQALGAAVPKIAVMPQDGGDTLKLLQATWEMHSLHADRPILTMAMGPAGAVSRVAGETFGSALTFGAVGQASAPGQLAVGQLRPMLDTLSQTAA